ncbi:MarR family transcriptional regulator [Ferruginivarius sediminum]|uniref:MarR family transcriptional regulator n=1 Tax=Ferruginivarius sediminum TaxID=2661937 RepID=A0A369T7U3_9PROT|nr:MarR family transcriptional regulator [Ferruginivarius sediminum]RDD61348.1 MarR family transcriptional regulator [Ferruginivarius sediminum]
MTEKDDTTGRSGSPMEMGMEMAKRMMAQMGAGSPDPMAMMQKMMKRMGEEDHSPPPMMQMCMGMCAEMLTAIKRTTDMAGFATPELHALFEEWLETAEDRAMQHLRETPDADQASISEALEIGEASAAYLLAHLARRGKVTLRAAPRDGGQ